MQVWMDHLKYLAAEHDIEIHWIPDWRYAASYETARYVTIPVPFTEWLYLVGLHEIGHIVGESEPDEAEEGRAWLWATRTAAMK